MLGSQIDLCFWNRLPNYFASAREAYKSLFCRNLWPDTGQHRSSANILISRLKQRPKKSNCLFVSGPNFRPCATKKGNWNWSGRILGNILSLFCIHVYLRLLIYSKLTVTGIELKKLRFRAASLQYSHKWKTLHKILGAIANWAKLTKKERTIKSLSTFRTEHAVVEGCGRDCNLCST